MWWNLKWWFVVAGASAVLCAGTAWVSHQKGRVAGAQEVQQMWDQERLATAQAHAAEMLKARQQEQALRALAAKLKKERVDEANRLAAEYAADIERLRDRPTERAGAGGVPPGAAAGTGCTGAGLARPDAEFLVGFAADAARLQSALDQCRRQYFEVEGRLNSGQFSGQ
jgi:hypothetical protein